MTMALEIALFIHIVGVVIWIGGMVFAQFCLRPALADVSPQLRLPLLEAVFGRFFNWVAGSVLAVLVTGGFLFGQFGGAQARWPVHAMATTGILMMLIFGHIRFAIFPRLRRTVQAQTWPDGARVVGSLRRMVTINLVLGIVTIAFGVMGRS